MDRLNIYVISNIKIGLLIIFIITFCTMLNSQNHLPNFLTLSKIELKVMEAEDVMGTKSFRIKNQVNTSAKDEHVKIIKNEKMIIRMAEIEIDSSYFDDYISILKEEAATSVRKEPGVLCIFPMYEKENPTQIKLLEIYQNQEAYEYHLKTPHFLHYKTNTLPMVKSLKLIDMNAIDQKIMYEIFKKIK